MNFQFCCIFSLPLSYLVFVGLLIHMYLRGSLMAFPIAPLFFSWLDLIPPIFILNQQILFSSCLIMPWNLSFEFFSSSCFGLQVEDFLLVCSEVFPSPYWCFCFVRLLFSCNSLCLALTVFKTVVFMCPRGVGDQARSMPGGRTWSS